MGIQINGNTDNISAVDGGLTVSDLELNQTGVSTFHSHLHVADQIIHLGDANTKIRFPAVDTFSVETAGAERLTITSTGEIKQYGFTGTSDTAADDLVLGNTTGGVNRGMTIWSNSSQNGSIAFADNDSNFRGAVQYIHNGDSLRFLTAGSERLRINSLGQISIKGTTTAFDTTGDLDALQLYYETDSGIASIGPYSSGGSTHLSFYTNSGGAAATEKVRIQSGGNVMIGGNYTSTNLGKLCVDGVIGIDDEGSGTSTLNIMTAANTRLKIQATSSLSQILTQNGNPFAIKTDAGTGGGTERLRIDSSGRVLIGTTDPGGGNADDLTVATSGNTGITIRSGTSNTGNIFFSDATSGAAQYAGAIEFHHSDNSLNFNVGNTNKLQITESNFLISQSNTDTVLNNWAGAAISIKNTSNTDNNKSVIYFTNSANGIDSAIQGIHEDADGTGAARRSILSFGTAGSGTSGSVRERFRITGNGRFGLNTNSPQYAMHLCPEVGQSRIDLHMTNSTTGHNNNDGVQFGYQNSAGAYIWNFENTPIYFGTSNTERFNIDSSGRVTKPYTPAFLAYHHGYDVNYAVGSTLPYMFTVYNTGNHYNTSNSTFTAPVAGRYLFSANANGNYSASYSGIPRAYWKINGSNVANAIHLRGSDATHDGLEQRSQTVIFNLAANDTVKIVVGQNQWDLFGANSFTGYLIG